MLEQAYEMLLTGSVIVLAVLVIASMVRSVLGPGISDRIIAVNMTGTMIIMTIAILSVHLNENYLVDVCLIYAMISFLAVVVLCKVYTGVYLQRKQMKADLKAIEDNLTHQEEHTDVMSRVSEVGKGLESAEREVHQE
ncbi:MAG: monovalent cation/H+ antiporter complex subunit F [Clostridium sp.]